MASYEAFLRLDEGQRRAFIEGLPEAQDTAASSGLREALTIVERIADGGDFTSSDAGLELDLAMRMAGRAATLLRAALAHSTPEPSLRDVLVELRDEFDRWMATDGQPDFRENIERRIAALPGLSLSAQPSEPGETA